MATAKPRLLYAVPDAPHADVVSLHAAAEMFEQRRQHLAYEQQHARTAAALPDVVKERDTLISKTLYRLEKPGADKRALLIELADAMFVTGYMDAAGEQRPLADATLATILYMEDIERKIRDEAGGIA